MTQNPPRFYSPPCHILDPHFSRIRSGLNENSESPKELSPYILPSPSSAVLFRETPWNHFSGSLNYFLQQPPPLPPPSSSVIQFHPSVMLMMAAGQAHHQDEVNPMPINYSIHTKKPRTETSAEVREQSKVKVVVRESTHDVEGSIGGNGNDGNDLQSRIQQQPADACQVCGGIAGKHHAYGGKVCHSCRAFFRRSVQTKYFEIFSCSGNEKCDINSSTRKSCKYCRFKKCLHAKMQISWVLSEQERERRFNKLKKSTYRNNLTTSDSPELSPNSAMLSSPLNKSLEINFTVEEQLRLENLRDYVKAMAVPRYEYFFNCEPDCLMHLAHACYFGGPLDYEMWKRFANASDLFHQEMFLNLDGMKELTMSDGLELIRSNGLASYSYLEAVYADEEDSGLSQSLKAAALSGQYPSMRSLLDILKRLGMTDKNPIIRYDQIYVSRWGASLEDESRHRTLLSKMKAFARPRGSSFGSSDQLLTALMRIIIAFNPDFVTLSQREVCEKILHQHCMLLHRYIKKTYGQHANAKFAQAMATCANARESAEILRKRIN